MATYTLKYFNVKGLCESIRYIFAWADVEFNDIRIEREDWPKLKDEQPFAQLPVLETVNTVVISQSTAIARFLGKTFGLTPNDDVKNAQLDALVAHMIDFTKKHSEAVQKGEGLEQFDTVILPFYFSKFENIATEGWFYGNTLTWVDIYFAGFIDTMETKLWRELLHNYPNLYHIRQKVLEKPSLQKYLAKRPLTAM